MTKPLWDRSREGKLPLSDLGRQKPDLSAGGFLYMLQHSMKGLESELKHLKIISVNWRPDE
jgi:hypothetical protein